MLKLSDESKQNDMFKKLWTILICLLLLLIPLQLAKGIIQERYGYKLDAQDAIAKAWAKAQNINPPQLTSTTEYDNEYEIPIKDYNVKVYIQTEIRKKGIFKIPVYTADVEQMGTFITDHPLPAKNHNKISMTVTDAKGYIETPLIKLGNAEDFTRYGDLNSTGTNLKGLKEIPFVIKYRLRGINDLRVRPAGDITKVTIKGNWKDPDFDGDFLPVKKVVNKNGFEAQWTIPKNATTLMENTDEKCGVSLLLPVDNYKMAHRAVKYGFLFISLTFLGFYFFEIITKIRIHPLQYIMIGLSMCIFYLLLLSISEFISFGPAYFIACAMTISLISIYASNVIDRGKNSKFTFILTGIITLLYLFLYVLLILKDYSLIVGSIGTFIIIATVMYATKDLEWYKDKDKNDTPS